MRHRVGTLVPGAATRAAGARGTGPVWHPGAMSIDENDLVPLRSEETEPAFDLVRRGYDRHQVDGHIAWLEARLRESESARATAEYAASQAAGEVAATRRELADNRPSWESLGRRVGQILTLAEEQAAELRQRAAADVEGLREQAQKSAVQADEAHARRLREAEREANGLVRQAQVEAERALRETQEQTAAAERVAQRRLADIERQRDQVLAQLSRLRETLAAAMRPLEAPEPTQREQPAAAIDLDSPFLEDDTTEQLRPVGK
jgi:chromosome segregation ATPase